MYAGERQCTQVSAGGRRCMHVDAGIAVTTGIITKVSASSVHWGRCECEESITDLGQSCTPTIPFDTLLTGMDAVGETG